MATAEQARAELARRELARRELARRGSAQPAAQSQAPETREQFVSRKMQETESSPIGALTSGARAMGTLGLSDILSKGLGVQPAQGGFRTAGEVLGAFSTPAKIATQAGAGIASPILRGAVEGGVGLGVTGIGPSIQQKDPSLISKRALGGAVTGAALGTLPVIGRGLRKVGQQIG